MTPETQPTLDRWRLGQREAVLAAVAEALVCGTSQNSRDPETCHCQKEKNVSRCRYGHKTVSAADRLLSFPLPVSRTGNMVKRRAGQGRAGKGGLGTKTVHIANFCPCCFLYPFLHRWYAVAPGLEPRQQTFVIICKEAVYETTLSQFIEVTRPQACQ